MKEHRTLDFEELNRSAKSFPQKGGNGSPGLRGRRLLHWPALSSVPDLQSTSSIHFCFKAEFQELKCKPAGVLNLQKYVRIVISNASSTHTVAGKDVMLKIVRDKRKEFRE